MTTTTKKHYYKILVWPCDNIDDNIKSDGIEFFDISESKLAIQHYEQLTSSGFNDAYITVKKMCNVWQDCIEEYGNEMMDCTPLECLPKYVQRRLGRIMYMYY